MSIIETVRIAFRALRANKLRTLLAMLGIIIGVAAVSAIMSIGDTFKGTIVGEFNRFGAASLFVMPGDVEAGPQAAMAASTLTFEDEAAVAAKVQPDLSGSTIQTAAYIEIGPTRKMVTVIGANEHFEQLQSWYMDAGRIFTRGEYDTAQPLAVVGVTFRDTFFGKDTDVIGKRFTFQGREVQVVGLLQKNTMNVGVDINNVVVLPSPFVSEALDIKRPNSLVFKFGSPEEAKAAKAEVEQILLDRHGNRDFSIQSQEELTKAFGSILDNVALFIGAIAGISLLVGGIGIMNIMLVSVKERTREIGIRKAIGARRRDVLLQFLVESGVLALLGGLLGVLLGMLMAGGAAGALGWTFVPSADGVVISFVVSTAIGIFFGLYPAWSASRLPAIEALRYE
ncbi:MAG: macB [Symbiobacteriaceae bacterium]|jgi:putative ABC transport system permease protein|nr:macB [Symbiobacteriaceae bacterium]